MNFEFILPSYVSGQGYTLSSVTGSDHVKYKKNPFVHCADSKSIYPFNMNKWSYKSKKRTGPVFYISTPSYATESV